VQLLIRTIALTFVLATGVGAVVLFPVIAPEIDEHVGFFTGRALNAVQSYEIGEVPLWRVVSDRFRDVQWQTYHRDVLFQTFVECVGTPRSGGSERRMVWYVEERPRWDEGPSLKIIVMTAFNSEARHLTPDLFDLRAWPKVEQAPAVP